MVVVLLVAAACGGDRLGDVYVVDDSNESIVQRFSASGIFLAQWGSGGLGDGQFHSDRGPRGVAVDGSGNVYVADRRNNRIQKFDASGAFLSQW